jgi:hypothetical protein
MVGVDGVLSTNEGVPRGVCINREINKYESKIEGIIINIRIYAHFITGDGVTASKDRIRKSPCKHHLVRKSVSIISLWH